MPTIAKKKTKMIVKDGNGGLLQLLPETKVDAELDEESSNPVASSAVAEALSGIEDAASNMGAIKVMDEEPTALNTTEYAGETLIAWVQPESWSITINTELAGTGEKTGQVPFNLYALKNQLEINASMKIDWGDGNKLSYSTDTEIENQCITYEYSNPGIYTITIYSNLFESLYIWSSNLNGDSDDPSVYRTTLVSINSPLPRLAGEYSFIGSGDCASIGTTTFEYCFDRCSSLQSIPEGLFDNNTQIINFGACFYYCSSLQSIPAGLFDKNTIATDFGHCFRGCTSLQSIPQGLFNKNTLATNFSNCFAYCSALTDFTLHIGSSSVSNCSSFVTNKSGTTRTVYVPSGSTTQTTFNAQASSLGLTIIGE